MADRRPQQAPLAEPHYRKLRPDTRTSFDQLILAQAGVLIDSPSYHRDGQEIRSGSSVPPRRAPWVRKFVLGWKNLAPGGVETRARNVPHINVAKDRLSSATFVSMVQATYLSNRNDTTILRPRLTPHLHPFDDWRGKYSTLCPRSMNGRPSLRLKRKPASSTGDFLVPRVENICA